ncbi:hypothetical protein MPNT_50180 [Candidatus Methylacidithermus pantelleriae]|uniref:Uncharacterized protein n=1 Tax=Candidatus Methylacidithermus pantelleriae TaxID=2744239 RepID=A0A8J2BRZ1_9BACT|nr:hypothetical protein MPNT_50180 [Candidatus Methylacidithermus pantelleriae]
MDKDRVSFEEEPESYNSDSGPSPRKKALLIRRVIAKVLFHGFGSFDKAPVLKSFRFS